jgi:hypothetical protein
VWGGCQVLACGEVFLLLCRGLASLPVRLRLVLLVVCAFFSLLLCGVISSPPAVGVIMRISLRNLPTRSRGDDGLPLRLVVF